MDAEKRKQKRDCGCVSRGSRWLSLCPKHQAECDEIGARWAREKAERQEEQDRWFAAGGLL